jgi:hypothetical protein
MQHDIEGTIATARSVIASGIRVPDPCGMNMEALCGIAGHGRDDMGS